MTGKTPPARSKEGTHPGRVRGVEAKVMSKLRHPSRSPVLADFLPGDLQAVSGTTAVEAGATVLRPTDPPRGRWGGHLLTRRGAGIFVATPSEKLPNEIWGTILLDNLGHVEMIYECRRAVEAETARLAALRATPQELQRIGDTAERTVTAAADDDFVAFFEADEAFHAAVSTAAHSMFLASVVDNVFGLLRRLKAVGFGEERDAMQRGAADHSIIAAAIRRGDPDAASDAMSGHIDNSVSDYRKVVRDRLFSRDQL